MHVLSFFSLNFLFYFPSLSLLFFLYFLLFSFLNPLSLSLILSLFSFIFYFLIPLSLSLILSFFSFSFSFFLSFSLSLVSDPNTSLVLHFVIHWFILIRSEMCTCPSVHCTSRAPSWKITSRMKESGSHASSASDPWGPCPQQMDLWGCATCTCNSDWRSLEPFLDPYESELRLAVLWGTLPETRWFPSHLSCM